MDDVSVRGRSKALFATAPAYSVPSRASLTRDDEVRFQRAAGVLRLGFTAKVRGTSPYELYQEGALKVRLVRTYGGGPEAVMINTAGGLTGGDRVSVSVKL